MRKRISALNIDFALAQDKEKPSWFANTRQQKLKAKTKVWVDPSKHYVQSKFIFLTPWDSVSKLSCWTERVREILFSCTRERLHRFQATYTCAMQHLLCSGPRTYSSCYNILGITPSPIIKLQCSDKQCLKATDNQFGPGCPLLYSRSLEEPSLPIDIT